MAVPKKQRSKSKKKIFFYKKVKKNQPKPKKLLNYGLIAALNNFC